MSVNILRFPSFQSLNILPDHLKASQALKITNWLETAQGLGDFERNQIERLVTYLRTVDRSQEDTDSIEDKRHDFAKFTTEYASRHNKDISKIFPQEFNNWYTTL